MATAGELVANGVKFLDENALGWADLIDLETLSLRHAKHCIVAQVTDWEYYTGLKKLGITYLDATSYGFTTELPLMFPALELEWVRVVTERQSEKVTHG